MLHIPAERRNEGGLCFSCTERSKTKLQQIWTFRNIAYYCPTIACFPTHHISSYHLVSVWLKIPWATALYFPYLWFIHQGGREVRECHCLKWARDTRGMAHRLERTRRQAMPTYIHSVMMVFLAQLDKGESARPPHFILSTPLLELRRQPARQASEIYLYCTLAYCPSHLLSGMRCPWDFACICAIRYCICGIRIRFKIYCSMRKEVVHMWK